MKVLSLGAVLAGILTLSSCACTENCDDQSVEESAVYQEETIVSEDINTLDENCGQDLAIFDPGLYTYNVSAQEDRIVLQHPLSRELVVCDSHTFTDSGDFSCEVEICARNFEEFGFVRLTNKPRFVNEDLDKSESEYPYRLYHRNDLTPRW